jgi:hypothetical protein
MTEITQGLSGCIFMLPLSDYDVPSDSSSMVKLQEWLALLVRQLSFYVGPLGNNHRVIPPALQKEVTGHTLLQDIPFVVLLNKSDVFRAKLARTNLRCCFKENPTRDYDTAVAVVKKKIERRMNRPAGLFSSIDMCATESDPVRKMFSSFADIIFMQLVKGMGYPI